MDYIYKLLKVGVNFIYQQFFVRVALHEMFHALGFDPRSYSMYNDSNNVRYPYKIPFVDPTSKKSYINTPQVKKFAREFFSCDSLPGFPLEDNGDDGTGNAHWEITFAY